MAPDPPRGEERRRLILRATLRVIADDGLGSVTHRRVAEVAGIPFSSITYWYSSRAELISAAFRNYLDDITAFLDDLESEFSGRGAGDLLDFLVELSRREFSDPNMVRAEYELILAAAREPELARMLVAWERLAIGRLAELLEALGAPRPVEAARTVLHLMRGNDLDRLTRPEATEADLHRRLRTVLPALLDVRRTPSRSRSVRPVSDLPTARPARLAAGANDEPRAPSRRR
jgi:DNA-binding transcriptional regulator YbjK